METFSIQKVDWETHRSELLEIRIQVFVKEQSVPIEEEEDASDPGSIHIIVYSSSGQAAATGRLTPKGWIGRMAVLKEYRGLGLGLTILKELTALGFEHSLTEIWLSAQTHAIPFYEKLGYKIHGEIYDDCNIPHQDMFLLKSSFLD